jgi:hypothetical protein
MVGQPQSMMLGFPVPQRGTVYQPRAKLWERVIPSPRVLKERRRCHRATISDCLTQNLPESLKTARGSVP